MERSQPGLEPRGLSNYVGSRLPGVLLSSSFFEVFYLFIFLERGEGREKGREGDIDEREKHQSVLPLGALACNPSMCPDRELNQRLFALQDDAPTR